MNMHYWFYVAYPEAFLSRFQSAEARQSTQAENYLEKENRQLVDFAFPKTYLEKYSLPGKRYQHFTLRTVYPGLLMGTGYAHEMSAKGDLALGFSFDYATGVPYLPGSSIKGVLRSAFAHPECIRDLCPTLSDDESVAELSKQIFGSSEQGEDGADVFLDAVVGAEGGKLLALDAITPHRQSAMKELGEPNPITFLKVQSNVDIRFHFLLTDAYIGGKRIAAAQKRELFVKLIKLFGVGAKTNVGYGTLI